MTMLRMQTILLVLAACLMWQVNARGGAVIELSSRTFDASVADGNVWLIEFYAPWCGHCRTFAPSYEELAKALETSQNNKDGKKIVKVAKIDGDSERAITSRFGIRGFPSFFIVDGWTVYEYEGSRSVPKLADYAKGGYKKTESLPFITSPMGPLGLLQGLFMQIGARAMSVYEWLTTKGGISPAVVVASLCIGGLMFGVFAMILLAILLTPKQKDD